MLEKEIIIQLSYKDIIQIFSLVNLLIDLSPILTNAISKFTEKETIIYALKIVFDILFIILIYTTL